MVVGTLISPSMVQAAQPANHVPVLEIQSTTENKSVEKAFKNLFEKVSIVIEKGVPILKLPEGLTDSKTIVRVVNKNDKSVMEYELKRDAAQSINLLEKQVDKLSYEVSLINQNHKINYKKVYKKDLTQSKPVIRYAYIIDSALVINAESELGLAEKPIYWKYSNEASFKPISPDFGYGYQYNKKDDKSERDFNDLFNKVNYDKYKRLDSGDFRIPVKIPSKIQLVVLDSMNHATPIEVNINKDNIILREIGQAPDYVQKLIDSSLYEKTGDYVQYKDLRIVNRGAGINLFETFKTELINTFGTFNTRELNITSPQFEQFDAMGIKFTKDGIARFTFSNGDKSFTGAIKVLGNKQDNIKSIKIPKTLEVNKKEVKLADLFEYEGSKTPVFNDYVIKINGQYFDFNETVSLEKDKPFKLEVINIKKNQAQEVEVVFKDVSLKPISIEKARAMFSDIKGNWAEDKIVDLVSKNIITGYGDGTFRPNNKISSRECLALMGRYAKTLNPEKLGKVQVKDPKFQTSTWGNNELTFALSRLPKNIFEGKNLDQAITREEVVYTMNYLYNYPNSLNKSSLKDLDTANYKKEIENLNDAKTIAGYEDGTFKPQDELTRAEYASLLYGVTGLNFLK